MILLLAAFLMQVVWGCISLYLGYSVTRANAQLIEGEGALYWQEMRNQLSAAKQRLLVLWIVSLVLCTLGFVGLATVVLIDGRPLLWFLLLGSIVFAGITLWCNMSIRASYRRGVKHSFIHH